MTVDFNENWSTYDISGQTLADVVHHHINPHAEAGTTHWDESFATTQWNGAHTAEVAVTVTIAVSMPNWVERDQASNAEQAEWDRFHRALTEHEQGHVELVHTYLDNVDQHLVGLDSDHAVHAFNEVKHHLRTASEHYDASTNHGLNAGTMITIPPTHP